jgi:hypothetical protein
VRAKPTRIVAIGDLNGADDALLSILRGTRLVDARGRWCGGTSELIQLGDIFNRGGGARRALELLLALRPQAVAAGGRVTVLLGNHEVLTTLRNEAYCTEDEYLSFATASERRGWPLRVRRAMRRILRDHPPRGPVAPLAPRLEAWRVLHVPGRTALRRALAPRARLGRAIRALPVAHVAGDAVFVHAGLLPRFARLGVDGLNAEARKTWREAPRFYGALSRRSVFRHPSGPLWTRDLVEDDDPSALTKSLSLLGVRRMVVGHTQTAYLGGMPGQVLMRHQARLVCVDVGLRGGDHATRAALVMQGGEGYEWTPQGMRLLWPAP